MSCLRRYQVDVFEELRREVDVFGQLTPLALKPTEVLPEEEMLLEEEEEPINEVQRMVSDIEALPPPKQKEVLDSLPLSVMSQSTKEMSAGRSKQL